MIAGQPFCTCRRGPSVGCIDCGGYLDEEDTADMKRRHALEELYRIVRSHDWSGIGRAEKVVLWGPFAREISVQLDRLHRLGGRT